MADETTDGTQEPENAEEVAARPAWLPPNFDTPEALAESYRHAASKITEQGQELAALRGQIEEIRATQATVQQQAGLSEIEQQLYEAFESGDGRTIAAANAYLIQQAIERQAALAQTATQQLQNPEIVAAYAEQVVAQEFPDWGEFRAKAADVIASNPALSRALEGETSPRLVAEHLKTAYKIAKAEAGLTASSAAAAQLAELARYNKNQAQTLTGGNSAQEAESYWKQVAEARSGMPSFRP